MHAIRECDEVINDVRVKTFGRSVRHKETDLFVEAGTTGFRGYVPREKSSRAFFSLDCKKGDFLFSPVMDDDGNVTGMDVACCGDGAVMTLVDSLMFAVQALMDQCQGAP